MPVLGTAFLKGMMLVKVTKRQASILVNYYGKLLVKEHLWWKLHPKPLRHPSLHLLHNLAHVATAFHHLHHLPGLPVLLEHLANVALLHARAFRNALNPVCSYLFRILKLPLCHRIHRMLPELELFLLDLQCLFWKLYLRETRDHLNYLGERPHLLHGFHLLIEVNQGELTLEQALSQILSILLRNSSFSFLQKRFDIAHPKEPSDKILRVEALNIVKALSDTNEFYWSLSHRAG